MAAQGDRPPRVWLQRAQVLLAIGWIFSLIGGIFAASLVWVGFTIRMHEVYEYGPGRLSFWQEWLAAGAAAVTFLGAGATWVAVVAAHHATRAWLAIWHCAWTILLIAGFLLIAKLAQENAYLAIYGTYAAAFLVGGVAMVPFGRALARLIVRIFLPPGLRGALAFLWLADDLDAPAVGSKAAPSADTDPGAHGH